MRPASNEAASYYFNYIDRVEGDDVLAVLHSQLDETLKFLSTVSEEKSRHRYAPDKWSLRELLNHVNDTERLFVFRALWFARGFEEPLPSFDQEIAVNNSDADAVSWNDMVDEFQSLRPFHAVVFPESAGTRVESLRRGEWQSLYSARPGIHYRWTRCASRGCHATALSLAQSTMASCHFGYFLAFSLTRNDSTTTWPPST